MKFLLLFLLFDLSALNQQQTESKNTPKVLAVYEDVGSHVDKKLTLSTDNIFLFSSVCECGTERLSKGKWRISEGYLYLNSYDDSAYSVFPTVQYEHGAPNDSVEIYFSDYFGKSAKLGLIGLRYEDTSKSSPSNMTFYLNENGLIKVSNKVFFGFAFPYQTYSGGLNPGDTFGYYFNDKNITKVNIKSDFDALYDRQLIKENLGSVKYKIVGNKLYSEEGTLSYSLNKNFHFPGKTKKAK